MESPHPDFSSGRTCNEKREQALKRATVIAFQKNTIGMQNFINRVDNLITQLPKKLSTQNTVD